MTTLRRTEISNECRGLTKAACRAVGYSEGMNGVATCGDITNQDRADPDKI